MFLTGPLFMAYPKAVVAQPVSASLECNAHDALIIISDDFSQLTNNPLRDAIAAQAKVDSRIGKQVTLLVIKDKKIGLKFRNFRKYFQIEKMSCSIGLF